MSLRNIALFGASGNLGHFILDGLSKESAFRVTIIQRNSSKAVYPSSLNVFRVSDTYPTSELVPALTGQDAVVIAFSDSGTAYERSIIDAAVKAGVKRFIPGHFGSNAEKPVVKELQPRNHEKDQIVDYLESKEDTGMTWSAIVTGLFFDQALSNTFMGFNLPTHHATLWNTGSSHFSTSTRPFIARTVISILLQPSLTANHYIYTSSFTTSQSSILDSLQNITGDDWTVEHVSSDEKIKEAKEVLENGATGLQALMANGTLALATMYAGKEEYGTDFEREGRIWNERLGLEGEGLEDVVRGVVEGMGRK